jgi:hypothetical protein
MSGVPDSADPSTESTDETTENPRDGSTDERTTTEVSVDVEDLAVRNYDLDRSRAITVTVRSRDTGETRLADRFDLEPAGTAAADLPAGTYEVVVETGGDRATAVCEVGPSPFESVVVEAGNGVVSVSQGF